MSQSEIFEALELEPKLISEICAINREENYSVPFMFRNAMETFVMACRADQAEYGIGHFSGLEAALRD